MMWRVRYSLLLGTYKKFSVVARLAQILCDCVWPTTAPTTLSNMVSGYLVG